MQFLKVVAAVCIAAAVIWPFWRQARNADRITAGMHFEHDRPVLDSPQECRVNYGVWFLVVFAGTATLLMV